MINHIPPPSQCECERAWWSFCNYFAHRRTTLFGRHSARSDQQSFIRFLPRECVLIPTAVRAWGVGGNAWWVLLNTYAINWTSRSCVGRTPAACLLLCWMLEGIVPGTNSTRRTLNYLNFFSAIFQPIVAVVTSINSNGGATVFVPVSPVAVAVGGLLSFIRSPLVGTGNWIPVLNRLDLEIMDWLQKYTDVEENTGTFVRQYYRNVYWI